MTVQAMRNAAGASASSAHIVFSTNLLEGDTIVLGSTIWTIVASGAVLASRQINVGASLTASLDAIVIALNLSTDPMTSGFTWTKTDTNTGLTGAADAVGARNNLSLSTTSVGATVTAPAGGLNANVVSLTADTTTFSNASASTATLPDGTNGLVKKLVNIGAGTMVVAGTYTGGTSASIPAAKSLVLCWLGTKWRVMNNDGATIS